MRDKILECVKEYNMLSSGDTVFAALSGGADSVAMTHILLTLTKEFNFSLRAVHINHNLRGDEAMRDEQFVRELCKKWYIPLTVESHDVAAIAKESGQSCEQAGRAVRYEVLARHCAQVPQGKIATAHTFSDVMETMLFNMIRGTSIGGLSPIPPVRNNIIRPLIGVLRCDVENYCKQNGLEFVTDSTNLSCDYSRNKIRNIVIPALRQINPSLEKAMQRLSSLASEDEKYLSKQARHALQEAATKGGYSIEKLSILPSPLLYRAIVLASKITPEARQIKLIAQCIEAGFGSVQLATNCRATVKDGSLFFDDPSCQKTEQSFWSVEIKSTLTPLPDGRYLRFEKISEEYAAKVENVNNLLFINDAQYDKINVKFLARVRKSGDVFTLAKRNCTKTLKKLFNELAVPIGERSRRVIVERDGEIIWIEGIGSSNSVRRNEKDCNIYYIELINKKTEDEQLCTRT